MLILLAAEHGVAPLLHPALMREPEQQGHGLVRDALLREVEVDPACLTREALASPWIGCEQAAQVGTAQLRGMGSERLPGGARTRTADGVRHG